MKILSTIVLVIALVVGVASAQIIPQPGGSSISTPVSVANGGNGTTTGQPAPGNLGTITGGGTATCNFTNSPLCVWAKTTATNFTLGAPTGVPAAGAVITTCYTQTD